MNVREIKEVYPVPPWQHYKRLLKGRSLIIIDDIMLFSQLEKKHGTWPCSTLFTKFMLKIPVYLNNQ